MQVTRQQIIRSIITTGWLAGLCLVLAGVPVPVALAAPLAAVAAAAALLRWGAMVQARIAGAVRNLRKRKTAGGELERA